MKYKEAIDKIKETYGLFDKNLMGEKEYQKAMCEEKEIIGLLQSGEKYKSKVKKLEGEYVKRETELFLIIKKNRKYKKIWREIKEDLREFDLEIKELEDVIKPEKLIKDMKIIINKYIKRK